MPFITTNGETSVDALLDRAFNRLTERQRDTARVALMRANPRLAEIERLPVGTIIEVPSRAVPRTKVSRKAEDPEGEVLKDIDSALTAFAKLSRAGFDDTMADLEKSIDSAQRDLVVAAVNKTDELKDLHSRAVAAMNKLRSTQEAQRAQFDKIIGMARADIKKRL
ncbi:hypothetical protein Q5Y75_27050 [Ruegeria sp. 2205SS24-7]|uniref:hypothetical protein n=1 Tax=Ruegeria discodermiae TaxID=3064389 RepID=UPI0027411CC4|nr:hypothetical protein [Ruegeria sp. 2205SS24-7]MDP5220850.1 hypothetical protein [Ruegeria sp. 2205SS24-7]